MAKGIRINRAKSSLQRNLQKLGRVNKQRRKNQKPKKEKPAIDPLTTTSILRKRLTNPKANITLSGKKRRLLIKKQKKEKANALKKEENSAQEAKNEDKKQKIQKMDIDS